MSRVWIGVVGVVYWVGRQVSIRNDNFTEGSLGMGEYWRLVYCKMKWRDSISVGGHVFDKVLCAYITK